jgi:hypothetical protein
MVCRAPVRMPDHFAHRAFGDRLHRAFGLQYVEEEIADTVRLDLPQHREIDVDDVLVAGKHQGFFRYVAQAAAEARIEADVDLVDAQRLRRERGLDRIGQVIVKPGLHLAHELAEAEHHADLVRLDAEEPREGPQDDCRQRDQGKAAVAEIARRQPAQPVLTPAQKFFEVGRSRRSRSPRAPGMVTPRHDLAPRQARSG